MKTPEQIAQQVIEHFDADNQTPEGERVGFGILADEDLLTWMVDAIEADRAQREHPLSDPLIELREWASTVSQLMAEDKSNDWREEIAQLEVIEERLDA